MAKFNHSKVLSETNPTQNEQITRIVVINN